METIQGRFESANLGLYTHSYHLQSCDGEINKLTVDILEGTRHKVSDKLSILFPFPGKQMKNPDTPIDHLNCYLVETSVELTFSL